MNYTPSHLDLELNNICNAACPMCSRTNINNTKPNNTKPYIDNKTQVTFSDFKHIIDKNPYIKSYNFCGNWGDPITTKDFLRIIEYIAHKEVTITIHTNGGLKSTSWWKKLGEILSCNVNNTIVFGIDGLEETNHIYRRHTNFNKIMENAKAYIINTKAKSSWAFIPFKHNEHQIAEAKNRAKELGFTNFIINHTGRFKSKNINEFIFHEDGIKNTLEPSSIQPKIISYEGNKIDCYAKREKRLFLSYDKLIFPCCQIETSFRNKKDENLNMIIALNDVEKLDASKYTFVDIIQSDIFKLIEMSWIKNIPATCHKKCSLKQSNVRQKIDL
jgi:MoaA/NifB/PqqE/SkfB family radical SAM enzyme